MSLILLCILFDLPSINWWREQRNRRRSVENDDFFSYCIWKIFFTKSRHFSLSIVWWNKKTKQRNDPPHSLSSNQTGEVSLSVNRRLFPRIDVGDDHYSWSFSFTSKNYSKEINFINITSNDNYQRSEEINFGNINIFLVFVWTMIINNKMTQTKIVSEKTLS